MKTYKCLRSYETCGSPVEGKLYPEDYTWGCKRFSVGELAISTDQTRWEFVEDDQIVDSKEKAEYRIASGELKDFEKSINELSNLGYVREDSFKVKITQHGHLIYSQLMMRWP